VEQLAAFTKILKTPLARADDVGSLKQTLQKAEGFDQIIIDTAGMSPFDPSEMRQLAKLMSAHKLDPLLVMPAGGDATESGEIARVFATLGVRWILPTRLDIARRMGCLLEAAHQGGMSFADASSTAKVADGLMGISPERIADLMISRRKNSEKVNKSLTPPRQAGQNRRL
jgi:flagellar biosynthesis protein FlhF